MRKSRQRTGVVKQVESLCRNCQIDAGVSPAAGLRDLCDKHLVHYLGQTNQLPFWQQVMWDRLWNEKSIPIATVSGMAQRALNSLVRNGAALKMQAAFLPVL